MLVIISDTSPIRALANLRLVHVLRELFGEVFVPPAVARELAEPRGRFDPIDITQWHFIVQKQAPNTDLQLPIELDPGELEAISLAVAMRADAILMDEQDGRAVAQANGLLVIGTLGLLARAKKAGIIPAVKPLVQILREQYGFFLSEELVRRVLRGIGEDT